MVRTFLSIISAISLSYLENSGQQVILFQELLECANVQCPHVPGNDDDAAFATRQAGGIAVWPTWS